MNGTFTKRAAPHRCEPQDPKAFAATLAAMVDEIGSVEEGDTFRCNCGQRWRLANIQGNIEWIRE